MHVSQSFALVRVLSSTSLRKALRRGENSVHTCCFDMMISVPLTAVEFLQVYARYINDPRNSRAHNVVFAKLPDEGRAVVRATRYIASGEELYVSYGRLYWAAASAKGFDPDVLSQSAVRNILAAARLQALLLPKDTGYT